APSPRGRELRLLVLALAIGYAGTAAGLAAASGPFSAVPLLVPGALPALALAMPALLVGTGFPGAQLLPPIAVALTGIGLVMVQRLDSALLAQQTTWAVIGAGAFCAAILIPRDLSVLARYKYTWALLAVVLLMAPLLPVVGREINGARIWIGV